MRSTARDSTCRACLRPSAAVGADPSSARCGGLAILNAGMKGCARDGQADAKRSRCAPRRLFHAPAPTDRRRRGRQQKKLTATSSALVVSLSEQRRVLEKPQMMMMLADAFDRTVEAESYQGDAPAAMPCSEPRWTPSAVIETRLDARQPNARSGGRACS